MRQRLVPLFALFSLMLSATVHAGPMEDQLLELQHHWAHIQYQIPEAHKEKAFKELAETAAAFVAQYPGRAEPLAWQGIILSTYAGARGGLSALGLVKDARKAFEQSIALDPKSLNGSAQTSLGSLYYQVPGWPISFGDDDKAERYLKAGLAINPDGIDSQYFYGDFLRDQGHYQEALQYFKSALSAPQRPDRPVADQGRRDDIQKAIQATEGKM